MSTFSITGLEEHEAALRAAVFENSGVEGAAYVLFREAHIAADPWDRRRHTKLLVREIIPIAPVTASGMHVTWDTASYVALLQRAQREELGRTLFPDRMMPTRPSCYARHAIATASRPSW